MLTLEFKRFNNKNYSACKLSVITFYIHAKIKMIITIFSYCTD